MATTFNPADLYPDGRTTLSNGDLTVTGHFFADGSARTIFSASSGKYYYEATCAATGTTNYQRGIAIGISTTRLDYGLGSPDTTSTNNFQGDANVYVQGSSAGTGTSYGASSVVCVALDLDNNLIWYRTAGGNWNGSSSNNPATGVGGKSIAGMSKPIYVMAFLTQGGDPVTFNFGDSAFTQTAPVGFGNFGPPTGPTNYTLTAGLGTVTAAGQDAGLYYGPWRLVGVGTEVVNTTTTSHTLTVPAGAASGDLLVAVFSTRIASATPMTLPTGGEWTLVGQQNANNILTTTSAVATGTMAYCVRGASNPNLTFTHPAVPSQSQGRIVAYRGVDPVAPGNTNAATTTAVNTLSVSVGGVTTTVPGALLVVALCGGQEATWSGVDATNPSVASGATNTTQHPTYNTWLERADTNTSVGADGSLGIFDAVRTAAGATGNIVATASLGASHAVIIGGFKPITLSLAPYTMAAGLGTLTAAGQPVVLNVALPAGLGTLSAGGQPVALRIGRKAVAGLGTVTLAGQPAGLRSNRTMAAGLGTLTLAGQPVALRSGRRVTAGLGTLTLSGQPTTLTYSRKLKMAAGLGVLTPAGQAVNLAYSGTGSKTMAGGLGILTLAGQPVTVRYARRMPAGLGTLTLAGQPATLVYSRKIKMAADLGIITLSGQPAILRYARKMAAGLGTLTLSGQPVTLTYSRKLKMAAGLGTLTLAGQDVVLTKASSSAKVIAAGLGTITIGGQPVTLRYAHKTAAGLGTITLSGQPAGLRRAKNLNALVGNIILTGQAAGLTYTHTANIRMAAGPGTLVLAGQSVDLRRVSTLAGQPGVLNFGRRVTINRW